jgi:hypothetical protein
VTTPAEIRAVAEALGSRVIGTSTLAGGFTGADLTVGDQPPWSAQLPGMAENCMAATPDGRTWSPARPEIPSRSTPRD